MEEKDRLDSITRRIIGAAIEVHRRLGPGLLESAYEICLAFELRHLGIGVEEQKPLPVIYRNVKLDCGYRLDLVVEDSVVVEIKAVDHLAPIHDAQLLSYLRLSGKRVGLLINFHVRVLKDGLGGSSTTSLTRRGRQRTKATMRERNYFPPRSARMSGANKAFDFFLCALGVLGG